jgi:hypothetical protein
LTVRQLDGSILHATNGSGAPSLSSGDFWKLALLLGLTAAVRLIFFTGMALGDDVFYVTQSLACAQLASWPPEPLHWHTRLGVILPTVLSLKTFGTQPLAFVAWPLFISTLGVLVCFRVADDLAGRRAAWLAAMFQAVFPLEVIYATHLFPDVIVGLFSTLSVWSWIRALRSDRARDYIWAGTFFAAGYLCRETVIMDGPIYLALWLLAGRVWRPRLMWVALIPALVVALELGLYAATTDSPLYRWSAIMAQQKDPQSLQMIAAPLSGGSFWTDPLLMLVFAQEFGLYYLLAMPVAVYAVWRWPAMQPPAVWLLVGFIWLYYGTTMLTTWQPMQRDARYAAGLTVPVVILVAAALLRWPAVLRWPTVGLLMGTGLFAAGLDQGNTILAPHRDFVQSPYARDAVLEPFEYVGARWILGIESDAQFACVTDQGRGSVVRLVNAFEGAMLKPTASARYFVFSPDRRPDLSTRLTEQGWTVVAELPGRVALARALVGQLLALVPTQHQRAERILRPRGLIVVEAPVQRTEADESPRTR